MALSLGRNYEPFKSPHFKLSDLLKKFDKTFGTTGKSGSIANFGTGVLLR